MKGTELEKMTEPQMVERVNMARFPQQLNPQQKMIVAKIAIEYGLDPLMGELLVIHGALFVPLSARLRKAQETEKLDGINTRPATEDERKGRRYTDPEDDLWVAEVWKKECSRPFMAFGGVKKKEVDKAIAQAKANQRDPEALPIVKDPAQHAEKRAISRGLRMGFHLPLPSAEDVGSEEFDRENTVTVQVVKETGEIIEGEDVENVNGGPTIENKAPKNEKPTTTTRAPTPKAATPVVTTITPEPEPEAPKEAISPESRGPGCETCEFSGWVYSGKDPIPCPDCFGREGSVTPDGVVGEKPPEPEPEKGSDSPQTAGELLTWVASHGKQYNQTWLLETFSWSMKDLNNRLMECYREIIQMTGWEPR